MAGSVFGNNFKVTTFGESHGKAIGCIIDGCPAGLHLSSEHIQKYLDRRKPGQSDFTTKRKESDKALILSGVFEGKTEGTPIAILIKNEDQHSKDYEELKDKFRPGHADFGYFSKYGIRDYRGGGRSSGRETAARVAAGAVAAKLLDEFGIEIHAYTKAIGPVEISDCDLSECAENPLYMPDHKAYEKASDYLEKCIKEKDSAGGVVECIASGVPAGLGDPVFDKLDARLAYGIMSIGAVKGFEVGDGCKAALSKGSENNDEFFSENGRVHKKTNHSGGILGGISDGSDIILRAYIKPTPSIARPQSTVTEAGDDTTIEIKGRHDPVIVPRAVVVVESMTALVLADALLENQYAKVDRIKL
ncbi:MAG: chorismate synthase [Lachnospiraceae bacterium]|uniref:Chorismate synthase n=1 Tax=Candidatus Weimeria bifida TaxID=2599074 RepID=A0A6N7J1G6_9FIRM|nr:chorismate synthase [Candidatus Weimeria bifida]RRF96360.1 MAG: chorismate synthase [Lachnospiraceae bacterium]